MADLMFHDSCQKIILILILDIIDEIFFYHRCAKFQGMIQLLEPEGFGTIYYVIDQVFESWIYIKN